MNYQKHYDALIDRARTRQLDGYAERHHIIPKCLGGSNDKDNLVRLTAEEHYVAHQLLVKLHPGNGKLVFAAASMARSGDMHVRSNKLYGWLKRRRSEEVSKALTGMKRGSFSDAHKQKLSLAKKGGTLSDEHKAKIRESMKKAASSEDHRKRVSEFHSVRKRSEETKAKISAALKGKPISREHAERSAATQRGRKQPIVECPHCSKSGGYTAMRRFHFDNCRVRHVID